MDLVVFSFMLATAGIATTLLAVRSRRPLGLEAWKVRRRHCRMKITPIGRLIENEVGRMVGRVATLEQTLIAPLSGRPCVYYVVIVKERWGNDWQYSVVERRGVAFAIVDRTGRAIIEPTNAHVALTFDHKARVGMLQDLTPAQAALIARNGYDRRFAVSPERNPGGLMRSLRFHEAVIPVDVVVSVVGTGVREPDREPAGVSGYRDASPTSLHVSHSVAAPLSLVCDPRR